MAKVREVEGDPDSCIVRVKAGGIDAFGRERQEKIDLMVSHYDDYGVLVRDISEEGGLLGGVTIEVARRALKKAGYAPEESRGWSYRPTRINQTPGRWPFGLWVGGISAVAFYFEVGQR